ncbi:MAG: bifunctional aldolase/short-chain dehydrogenase [Gemmatimonadetes bacterium]|nr:MAG: bifunctional aldolase/short-chain dehydrogenase [Gemmatimonadota bacterium]
MKSLWNDEEAASFGGDPLALRVYTSRLLGRDQTLVMHGGGNTSVKTQVKNRFGESEDILYVKGSGWDLATIEAAGFAPCRLNELQRLIGLDELSDTEMVKAQRVSMIDPTAPNPSVEAILHAVIPFAFVDHTHADAVVAISNTPSGEERIREIYGERVLIIPYVMPGFVLAKKIYEMTHDIDWNSLKGLILLNHGVFTFADDARTSYENMIQLVDEAEQYLYAQRATDAVVTAEPTVPLPLEDLARLRKAVSRAKGHAMLARINQQPEAVGFSGLSDVGTLATRGPLTPDHVIRTKRTAAIIESDVEEDVTKFVDKYQKYFDRNTDGTLTCLDPAPRWAVWKKHGTVSFGQTVKEIGIVSDIVEHTIRAIQWGEALATWKALPEKEIFDVEYWELEQAKLRKGGTSPEFQGKTALVTGAASGIGKACTEELARRGAVVVALDTNPQTPAMFESNSILGITSDVTDPEAVQHALETTIRQFGGLDMLISNAGIFPSSQTLAEMDGETWQRSLELNLTSHQRVLQACLPFLTHGIDPAVVFIASKNVPAPGPGAGAYSVAKAGLTQLARVAALECAALGIRVNVLHPNAVFDTGLWTPEVLESRAKRYKMTVEAYKTNNLLKTEVTSADVARLACAVLGAPFAKTTGAQIPVDGGNDRVI